MDPGCGPGGRQLDRRNWSTSPWLVVSFRAIIRGTQATATNRRAAQMSIPQSRTHTRSLSRIYWTYSINFVRLALALPSSRHRVNNGATRRQRRKEVALMKRLALAIAALGSQAVISFAGPPPSKEIVTPPPPPVSYFRGNEFDVGIFATYVTGTNGGGQTRTTDFANGDVVTISGGGSPHGWGGGMDFTYFLPWKYLGFRFQGAGVELSSSTVTGSITGPNNSFHFSRSNSFSAAAGVLTGDIILRLPLDDFWPNVHLAPYVIGGGGGVFTGGGGSTINTRFPELNQ